MKPNRMRKNLKLFLGKTTITNLDYSEQGAVKSGSPLETETGCSNSCSDLTVDYTRGPYVSCDYKCPSRETLTENNTA